MEETREETIITRKWKTILAAFTLLFCWVTIGWLLIYGSNDNSLHESALSWCFFVMLGTLAGIGLGSLSDHLPTFGKK